MREEFAKDYDDYTLFSVDEEGSGSLSPFTFLIISLTLFLFGLVMAYSSSYDKALSLGFRHYHYLFEMAIFALIALLLSIPIYFMGRNRLERIFFFTLPLSLLMLLINTLSVFIPFIRNVFPYLSSINGADAFIFSSTLALTYYLPSIKEREMRGYFYIHLFLISFISSIMMSISFSINYVILFSLSTLLIMIISRINIKLIIAYVFLQLSLVIFLYLASINALPSFFSSLSLQYHSSSDRISTISSMLAIREGSIFGKGLGLSAYKLSLIERVEDEYIYAVIAEEIGLIGTIVIIALLLLFLFLSSRCAKRSIRRVDSYITSNALTFAFLIVFKSLLSMITASGALPFAPISMPFFSANGFSLFITIIECAFLYRFMNATGRGNEKMLS